MSQTKNSRRKFLSKTLLGRSTANAESANSALAKTGETIKMLSPDGQLVEIDKRVLENAENRKKVNNEEILKWANTKKK